MTYLIEKAAADAGDSPNERLMKTSSDLSSWTNSISRVASTLERQQGNEGLVRRIRAEFLEMPGLCLTIEQAQRLWSLEPRTCEALLRSLIDARFLCRTERGLFVLCRSRG